MNLLKYSIIIFGLGLLLFLLGFSSGLILIGFSFLILPIGVFMSI